MQVKTTEESGHIEIQENLTLNKALQFAVNKATVVPKTSSESQLQQTVLAL